MAEEKKDETESKGGIIKIAIMAVSGIVLLGIGLGLGMFLGGEDTDPSSEISQIIEKKENPDATANDDELEEIAEVECTDEEKDEEGNCPTGPKKMPKIVPEEEIFATTYYEFPGNFTTNLKGSKRFLQISVGVSTQYDDTVMANVESHQLAMRSEILTIMSEYTPDDIAGREGKDILANALKDGINSVLEKLEGFGGVENVHFTSFVLQ
tara:strand:+ start:356 stop:985 length:630 start_codon:yes stop_codon:yes gene_type:complete